MFTVRTTLPEEGNKFYNTTSAGGYSRCIKGKPTVKGLNVLCNCVGWASSRFNEVYSLETGYKGAKYWQLNCNAEDFITRGRKYGLEVSLIPVVGGIMVWEGKGSLSGHVAFVERVDSSTQVYTSESGYNHYAFANHTRIKGSGNWGLGSNYKYLGCLINPGVHVDPSPSSFLPQRGYFKKGDTSPNIGKISAFMYRMFPLYTSKKALGNYYGNYLLKSIKEFQKRTGLKVDGLIGPLTLDKLVSYGFKY